MARQIEDLLHLLEDRGIEEVVILRVLALARLSDVVHIKIHIEVLARLLLRRSWQRAEECAPQ